MACLIIAGTTVATARMKKRYADKAQQVVLAAAVFDNQGRILVSHDGVIPSEKITDSFLGKVQQPLSQSPSCPRSVARG